ncbi:acid phosphatase det1 [Entophlyctis luteolus]|nr:acid phosphatase det1 [Entophlyctis luteolus]
MHAHPGSTSVFALVRRRQERPTSYREMRKVYQTIVPDAVARNCELPTGARVSHILGFTLSGSLLLCLSDSHHSVLAFAYGRTDNSRPIAGPIPDASFLSFFHKNPVFKTTVTVGTEQLTTDFCVFTPNRRFVILASARVANNLDRIDRAIEDVGVRYPHGLNSLRYLDNITFWLICLSTGAILDKLKFPVDHILLSSAAGVQIHNDILAITSIKNQTIHFFHVQESGRFVKVREIGWHNYDDDEKLQWNLMILETKSWKGSLVDYYLDGAYLETMLSGRFVPGLHLAEVEDHCVLSQSGGLCDGSLDRQFYRE